MPRFAVPGLFALVGVVLSAAPARSQGRETQREIHWEASNPVIYRVHVDEDRGVMAIGGARFGREIPRVMLDDDQLSVLSTSSTEILALLPTPARPGTYRLVVITHRGRGLVFMDVTIGAVGPRGLKGRKDMKGRKASKELPALRDRKDPQDRRVRREPLGLKDRRACKVPSALRDRRARSASAHPDHRACRSITRPESIPTSA
jgi:hypothetical protein